MCSLPQIPRPGLQGRQTPVFLSGDGPFFFPFSPPY